MHRVFLIAELVKLITDAVKESTAASTPQSRRTFLALALTCKALHHDGLDALWSTQTSLEPILRLLPGVVTSECADFKLLPFNGMNYLGMTVAPGTVYMLTAASVSDNWSTFLKYSSKIRHLIPIKEAKKTRVLLIDNSVHDILRQADRLLFPNLRTVHWPIDGIRHDAFSSVIPFLGPMVRSFSVGSRPFFHPPSSDLGNVFRHLKACVSLKELSIGYPLNGGLRPIMEDLLSSAKSLESFCSRRSAPEWLWASLARCPRLRMLAVTVREDWVFRQEPIALVPDAFPALTKLDVTCNALNADQPSIVGLADPTAFLHPSLTRRLICLSIAYYGSAYETAVNHSLEDTFSRIANKVSPYLLQEFSFICKTMRSTIDGDLPELSPHVFRPLMALHNLTKVDITVTGSYKLNNALLNDIAEAWPRLRCLSLKNRWNLWPNVSEVTLEGLLPLALLCPDLCALSVVFNDTATDSFSDFPQSRGRRGEACQELSLGLSTFECAWRVATFLSDVFPNATIYTDWRQELKRADLPALTAESHRDAWKEVMDQMRSTFPVTPLAWA